MFISCAEIAVLRLLFDLLSYLIFPHPPTNLATWAMIIAFLLQDGTSSDEWLYAVVVTEDGFAVLAGIMYGSWNTIYAGSEDFAAVKLDANGTIEWKWQVSEEVSSQGLLLSLIRLESAVNGRSCG